MTAIPRLPAVAVVDRELVERRRRTARPAQRVVAAVAGVAVGVLLAIRPDGVGGALLLVLVVVAAVLTLLLAPWAAIRPPSSWYLGIEADGVRLPYALAPGGELFLPWWAVGRVRPRRYGGLVPTLGIGLRPEGAPLLAGVDPAAAQRLLRRGFSIGLQGTSMTPRQAADIIATVRR